MIANSPTSIALLAGFLILGVHSATDADKIDSQATWLITTSTGEFHSSDALNVTSSEWILGRSEEAQKIAPQQIVSVMQRHTPIPDFSKRGTEKICRCLLTNDDVLVGKVLSLSDTELILLPLGVEAIFDNPKDSEKQQFEIALESIRQLTWRSIHEPFPPPLQTPIQRRIKQDQIELTNGDRIRGDLVSLDTKSISLDTEASTREISLQEVTDIQLNPDLTITPSELATRTLLKLANGNRITLKSFQLVDFNKLLIETQLAGSITVSLDSLISLVSLSPGLTSLTDRVPTAVNYEPFLSQVPRYRINESVTGGPLLLNGCEYLSGFGVHSKTELTFALEPDDETFLSQIGIDDSTVALGSAVFRVLTDGVETYRSKVIRGGHPPQSVRINLKDKSSLTLIVEFADRGDVLDRANWGQTLIFKTSQPQKNGLP